MKRLIAGSALALMVGATGLSAQETEEAPAPQPAGPCTSDIYHAFDFWLGEWEVRDQNGTLQGHNTITSEEGGCLILESWAALNNGGTGQSYNYVDPASGKWRQIWVSTTSNIDYEGGPTEAGGIKLEGEITYRGGATFPFTGEWAPQEDGSVRQYFEQYDPEADAWNPWFLGIYTRVEVDSED